MRFDCVVGKRVDGGLIEDREREMEKYNNNNKQQQQQQQQQQQ